MGIREIFASNLRSARKAAGLSQEELAHRADVDRTYVSSLERCVYAAGLDVVDKLAKVLGVEAADLLQKPEGKIPSRRSGVSRKSVNRKKLV
jgi:transcriptional regulator with XRE-family HTH domain